MVANLRSAARRPCAARRTSRAACFVSVQMSPQQIAALGRTVVDALVRADLVELPAGSDAAAKAVADQFVAYFKAAATLEADAERLADEHLRAARAGAAGIDRRRVVQMIKEKLASERGLPV